MMLETQNTRNLRENRIQSDPIASQVIDGMVVGWHSMSSQLEKLQKLEG